MNTLGTNARERQTAADTFNNRGRLPKNAEPQTSRKPEGVTIFEANDELALDIEMSDKQKLSLYQELVDLEKKRDNPLLSDEEATHLTARIDNIADQFLKAGVTTEEVKALVNSSDLESDVDAAFDRINIAA